jgi:hypothetical protein
MIDFIYNNPTWLWGSVFVALVTAISCLGLIAMHRFVPVETRRQHNDVAQAMMSVVGTSYAVLIAFIAVTAWQSFTDGDKSTNEEANHVGNLYWGTGGLPDSKIGTIREDVRFYLDMVINLEWPAQQKGESSHVAQPLLHDIHEAIVNLGPETPGETVVQGELLRTMNRLYSARRIRQLAAQAAVPEVLWWIIFLGTVLTLGFTYLFGVQNFRMHLVMTGLAAASFSMVIVLIVALDRPFRGELCISTDAYDNLRTSIDRTQFPQR